MKMILLATVGFTGLVLSPSAWAIGTLMQVSGTDVSGTTEYIYHLSHGHYTLLGATPVNTTVPHEAYGYVALFYFAEDMIPGNIVVENQAGTKQVGFTAKQVVPVGTVIAKTSKAILPNSDVGGGLYNLTSSDTSGTTEYVWSVQNGLYSLLGSSSVNTTISYSAFAYNVLFYLPVNTSPDSIVVTNQAGTFQTGYALQKLLPRGLGAPATPSAMTSRAFSASATKANAQSPPLAGQLNRAIGSDVSGTTAFAWYKTGSTYTLLGAGPVNAANPHAQYGYQLLFLLPATSSAQNVVVSDQAGTIQFGAVIDSKSPTVVAAPK